MSSTGDPSLAAASGLQPSALAQASGGRFVRSPTGGRQPGRRPVGRPPKRRYQPPSPATTTKAKGGSGRGPGRPPLHQGRGGGRGGVRRGPGRPPGPSRKKVAGGGGSSATAATASSSKSTGGKRKYTKRKSNTSGTSSSSVDYQEPSDGWTDDENDFVYYNPPARHGASSSAAGYETDPETALDADQGKVTTIHWDPTEGSKIGWKARLLSGPDIQDGRIEKYCPYSHKHKIVFDNDDDDFEETQMLKKRKQRQLGKEWMRIRHTDLHVATRLVWAHVKGYAWWPAMVMELSSINSSVAAPRDGYVHVHFIGSPEVATLRDSMDCVRPFSTLFKDPVIEKSKKKRNAKAIANAQWEEIKLQQIKNAAARHYANKAFAMADPYLQAVGKRIKLFSSDINYPDGASVIGVIRQYSFVQKKWLVSFELPYKLKHQRSAMWVNLQSKDCNMTILQENDNTKASQAKRLKQPNDLDLVPFLFGFSYKLSEKPPKIKKKKKKGEAPDEDEEDSEEEESEPQLGSDKYLANVLSKCCRGCVDAYSGEPMITCSDCKGNYHLTCLDPLMTKEMYQKLPKDEKQNLIGWKCSKCTICLGCYQKDIVFGSHTMQPVPPTVSLPPGEQLPLCSMCVKAYEDEKYCPNCAHSWDDIKYQKVLEQMDEEEEAMLPPEPAPKKPKGDDSGKAVTELTENMMATAKGMPPGTPFANGVLLNGARVDPSWYYAENNVWGYTEGDMLVCDRCDLWVHAGCAGLSQEEYDMTSEGEHPIYSKEFLCRVCCRKRCIKLIQTLRKYDEMMLFAVPVTEKVAPNYRDVIKNPMDLQTMMEKAKTEEYLNYAWVRDSFALMVFNALTFNRFFTKFWNEGKRYYEECLKEVFNEQKIGKAAPPGKYDEAVKKNFEAAEAFRQMEFQRVQEDASTEKKDLVAGAEVAKVTLLPLREKPPDESSCLPYQEVKVKSVDAYFCSWMDCCFTCGSSGASDTMIFCVDCGEGFHSFCANVPIHSMDIYAIAGWRCPNCKVCEISGDVPADELRMLFCEMCDRAFTLDLLDPPLRRAPSGLWICGQCVDCKVCKNTSEPPCPGAASDPDKSSISLKYWSRDPEKCYRCGGCDGIAEQIQGKKLKCQVCRKILREDDGNFVNCDICSAQVHISCDKRADEFLKMQRTEELYGSRTQKAQKTNKPKFHCPRCAGIQIEPKLDYTTVDTSRKTEMHEQAWQSIVNGELHCDNFTPLELHGQLLHQLDWQTREMWRDEYVSVVEEGIEFYKRAKSAFGDPRTMVQDVASGKLDLPTWMGQRAYRFLVLAKRWKWDTEGFSAKIEGCVFAAKLAAAFLTVACQAMKMNLSQSIKNYDRVSRLLKAPQDQGVFEIPMDQVRCKDRYGSTEDQLVENFATLAHGSKEAPSTAVKGKMVASPLCGWGRHVDPASVENQWRDPRECCLCHLCGDDDAGFPEPDEGADAPVPTTSSTMVASGLATPKTAAGSQPAKAGDSSRFARLGRLLPMSDGHWVHASCALWSSEVWESPRGGLINAMEKARSRGAQLKCFGCGRAGATVGCNKPNCSFNYHFPCAKASGCVFTSKKQMFCANHRANSLAGGHIIRESFEAMKTLIVAPDKKVGLGSEKDNVGDSKELCFRIGSLIVHSLGTIVQDIDGFHTEDYIYPAGYVATRIFWSTVTPRTRTVYILKVERNSGTDNIEGPLFTITPGDAPSSKIRGRLVSQVYKTLIDRVRKVNSSFFSHGDLFSRLPMMRKTRKKFYALNGPQFFGFGLDSVRERLESAPGIEAVAAALKPTSSKYRFCLLQPNIDSVVDLQRKRAAVAAERALENASGCARTEGRVAVDRSGGSGRITRALVRSVEEEGADEVIGPVSNTGRRKNVDIEKNKLDKKRHQALYAKYKSVPMEDRLVARRSHIHGWGLFTKIDIKKDEMITEYMGEIIRQCIADKRENQYEISGEGSCYMFRLDMSRIMDATVIGCMARFMNHCCQPNAYAKIITVDTELGVDKKIAVFALRDIAAGEEITYDYKFPVEDGSLRCTCGAPNCIGRMN